MISIPYMAKICFHLRSIGPAGEGLGIRKPMVISEVKALQASIPGCQNTVCRYF